jgi:hypothetical protein
MPQRRSPLPLWERSDRIARCDPGEGFLSCGKLLFAPADTTPHPSRTSSAPPSPTRGEGTARLETRLRTLSDSRCQTASPSLRAKRSNPECVHGGSLDCFVACVPRHDEQQHSRGTKCARVMQQASPSKIKRAQGMPDAEPHPQPCVQMEKARKQVTTGTPNIPAFPARWFTGLFRALPGVRAC